MRNTGGWNSRNVYRCFPLRPISSVSSTVFQDTYAQQGAIPAVAFGLLWKKNFWQSVFRLSGHSDLIGDCAFKWTRLFSFLFLTSFLTPVFWVLLFLFVTLLSSKGKGGRLSPSHFGSVTTVFFFFSFYIYTDEKKKTFPPRCSKNTLTTVSVCSRAVCECSSRHFDEKWGKNDVAQNKNCL